MIRENLNLMADPVPFDEDYYVIDEPPAEMLHQPGAADEREPMLQLATHEPVPRLHPYWPGLVEFDIDWADEDAA